MFSFLDIFSIVMLNNKRSKLCFRKMRVSQKLYINLLNLSPWTLFGQR